MRSRRRLLTDRIELRERETIFPITVLEKNEKEVTVKGGSGAWKEIAAKLRAELGGIQGVI